MKAKDMVRGGGSRFSAGRGRGGHGSGSHYASAGQSRGSACGSLTPSQSPLPSAPSGHLLCPPQQTLSSGIPQQSPLLQQSSVALVFSPTPVLASSPAVAASPTCDLVGIAKPDTRRLIAVVYGSGRPTRFEPQDVTRGISKDLLQHLPGPVAHWKDYPKEVLNNLLDSFLSSHRFATAREEVDARVVWMRTAADRFRDYLSKKKTIAKKAVGGVDDPLQWKGHGPTIIRQDYWDAMCNQWAKPEFRARSATAVVNRSKGPEANLYIGGSISFMSHKKKMEAEEGNHVPIRQVFDRTHKRKATSERVSGTAQQMTESYDQEMMERYGDNLTQHLDQGSLDTSQIIASSQGSFAPSTSFASSTSLRQPTTSNKNWKALIDVDEIKQLVKDELFNAMRTILAPIYQAMGVTLPPPLAPVVPPLAPQDPQDDGCNQDDKVERDEDVDVRLDKKIIR